VWFKVVSNHLNVRNEPYLQYLGCRLRSATACSVMFGGAATSKPMHLTVLFRYRNIFLPSKTGYVHRKNKCLMSFLQCTYYVPVSNLHTCTLWPWHSSILNLKRLSPVLEVKCPNYLSSFVTKTQSPGMDTSQIMTADLVSSTMAETYCAVLAKGTALPTA
jgi:hypothetical protein